MLAIPPQGLSVFSSSPSADTPDNSRHRQLLHIALNDQILSQIQACGGKGLRITFGANAGLQIGDQVHKFSGVVPEAQSASFEVYRQKKASSANKIDIVGKVTHKIQVRRGLDSTSMERIKNRTEEAERERNSRKYENSFVSEREFNDDRAVLIERPSPSNKRATSLHTRHNSSNSKALLSVIDNKSGAKGSGARSLPSSPLLKPTTGSSTPKYLPIGGSPRIAPLSSPRLNPSSPKPATTPLRVRLIHILALGPATEQVLQEKTRALRTELSTCLQDVARKVTPGSMSWELKDESYRDIRPREWRGYTSEERDTIEKKQKKILAQLPSPVEIVSPIAEIPKRKITNDETEISGAVVATPKRGNSPVKPQSTSSAIPAKRQAEDEVANPVRKVGGGIISTKKRVTKVMPNEKSTPKSLTNEAPLQSKTSNTKKAKNNPKFKSAEKITDSDSEIDIPLETQIKTTQPTKATVKQEPRSTGYKSSSVSTFETLPKRPTQISSPPVSSGYRTHSSSTSSSNPYSPPKKRSPLATNEPVTARRAKSPTPRSPPPSAKKRAREDDLIGKDKRQKLHSTENGAKPNSTQAKKAGSPYNVSRQKLDSDSSDKKISQEHHDLANRFRKLYPEYQELHRRLRGLDTDRLAKERSNVDKLFRMQEQLEKWKAALWKAAGEKRHVTTERPSGMVGVKV